MGDWLRSVFRGRPAWMNAVMVFCAYMTFIYMPFDVFLKPVEDDAEVWFGVLFDGWTAKLLAIPHWIVYAGGLYGFRRMRPWMAIAAPLYTAQVAFGMFLWPVLHYGSLMGFLLGLIAVIPFGLLTAAFWNARDVFLGENAPLSERYGGWAVVTGASAGIGEAFARGCAREGLNVVLVARRADRLEHVANEIREKDQVETKIVALDLTTVDAAEQLAAEVADLDVGLLVNNAGFGLQGRFTGLDLARLEAMVKLNCTLTMSLTHRLLPGMLERGRGGVIVVGSAAGRQPLPLHGVYSATKAFDLFFAESLAVELEDRGVDVLVVEPGTVETEFQAVSGQIPHAGMRVSDVVDTAFDALGQQSSVIVGWKNWLRSAMATRIAPRPLGAYIGRSVMAAHTPADKQ